MFDEIPNLLVIIQIKTNPNDLNDLSRLLTKQTIYEANSLGMYNWKMIS